ncbi:MAG TPA: alpha amylase N-terminal ig-like domain-containing protein [Ktedonobacterales bacterium]
MYDLALWHGPRAPYAYPLTDERLRVRLRAALGDQRRPSIEWSDRQDSHGPDNKAPMRWLADDQQFRYWEADVTPVEGRVRYVFRLDHPETPESAPSWFGENGASTTRPGAEWPDGYFHWPYIHPERLASTPAWLRRAICYEIFPDRFARGQPPIAPDMAGRWPGAPTHNAFWGGDLAGVLDRLNYIQALGMNLIWLTPIFQAPSNHKYDTEDYGRIDPHFGDEALFNRLVGDARRRGIGVVLDGVFNHSGFLFTPWQDVVARGQDSPYWGWFDVRGARPDRSRRNYRTFAHTAWMPRLRTANPEVQAYLIERAKRWTRMGIAGWRLDVADEVDPSFWRAFRRELRAINPDLYLVGEIAYDAGRWLEGDQFDGVMNYPLRRALLQFAAPGDRDTPGAPPPSERLGGADFLAMVSRVRTWTPGWADAAALNPLSTHDVPRFLTAVGGDEARWRLGLTFLMTAEGVPLVYYGDEVGLEGGYDPDTRRPMPWDAASQRPEMLTHTRTLTRLRAETPALRGSGFRPLATFDRRVAVYLRGVDGREELRDERGAPSETTNEVALIALNPLDEVVTVELEWDELARPALPGALTWPAGSLRATDLLTGGTQELAGAEAGGRVRLQLEPLGALILAPA